MHAASPGRAEASGSGDVDSPNFAFTPNSINCGILLLIVAFLFIWRKPRQQRRLQARLSATPDSADSPRFSAMQPVGGGALYWGLRSFFTTARHRFVRYGRLMDMNWDFARASMNGVPKFSYDPSVNDWRTGVDNEHWTGPGGMVWSDISMQFIWWSFWAFWVYFTIARWHVNGKMDTLSKWRKHGD